MSIEGYVNTEILNRNARAQLEYDRHTTSRSTPPLPSYQTQKGTFLILKTDIYFFYFSLLISATLLLKGLEKMFQVTLNL